MASFLFVPFILSFFVYFFILLLLFLFFIFRFPFPLVLIYHRICNTQNTASRYSFYYPPPDTVLRRRKDPASAMHDGDCLCTSVVVFMSARIGHSSAEHEVMYAVVDEAFL